MKRILYPEPAPIYFPLFPFSVVDPCETLTCHANSHCDDTVPEGACVCDSGYQNTSPAVCSRKFPSLFSSLCSPKNLSTRVPTSTKTVELGCHPNN